MKVTSAKFVTSVVDDQPILHDGRAQVAFIGRSNVGKSSLMNMLMERKDLVKSSGTPGKTRTVNFFLVNDSFYLVDLPGYGYAKASRTERAQLRDLIVWFLTRTPRDQRKIVLVIDSKAGLTAIDVEMIEFLHNEGLEFVLVANKIDKLNQKQRHELGQSLGRLLADGQAVVHTSCLKKIGLKDLQESTLS